LENFTDGATDARALSAERFCLLATPSNDPIGKLRRPFSAGRKRSLQSVQTFAASFRPFDRMIDNELPAFAGATGTVWELAATPQP
jgi:hypothetical protein